MIELKSFGGQEKQHCEAKVTAGREAAWKHVTMISEP